MSIRYRNIPNDVTQMIDRPEFLNERQMKTKKKSFRFSFRHKNYRGKASRPWRVEFHKIMCSEDFFTRTKSILGYFSDKTNKSSDFWCLILQDYRYFLSQDQMWRLFKRSLVFNLNCCNVISKIIIENVFSSVDGVLLVVIRSQFASVFEENSEKEKKIKHSGSRSM